MHRILAIEAALLGRFFQDGCYFINTWGTLA
jgi:hypothetical protein